VYATGSGSLMTEALICEVQVPMWTKLHHVICMLSSCCQQPMRQSLYWAVVNALIWLAGQTVNEMC